MIKIGIVGIGGIAAAHQSAYGNLDTAKIVARCDKIPERAAGKATVQINIDTGGGAAVEATPYTDYRLLLQDPEVDVVDICLPTDLHAEVAVAALNAGKHVLCEKPMALTVEQCDSMIAAAEANDRIFMVAHCIRFWPQYVALKEIVDSGQYGRVISAYFRRLSPLPTWSSENWLLTPSRSGGAIHDLHIHDADYLLYLLGMPQAVMAHGVEDAHGIGQLVTAFQYDGPRAIIAEGGWSYTPAFPFRMTFTVRLEGAAIEWDDARAEMTVYPQEGEPYTPELLSGTGYDREIAYFVDCVAKGVKPDIVTPQSARESVRLVLAEAESVRSGQVVTL